MTDFIYRNPSDKIVVVRCIGPLNFFLEKAIFPFEIFTCSAPENTKVEIWGLESYGPKLEQRFRIHSEEKKLPNAS